MNKRYWVVGLLLAALLLSATVAWATTVYWRNNQYQLPGYYNSRVLSAILTDHKLQIDSMATAIANNTTAINNHVADTTTAHSYDARYVRTSDTTERVVSGVISSTGTIFTGAGFTSTRNGVGNYTITFNTPFTSFPRGVFDVRYSGGGGGFVDGVVWGLGSVSVTIFDQTGAPADRAWDFVVFGR